MPRFSLAILAVAALLSPACQEQESPGEAPAKPDPPAEDPAPAPPTETPGAAYLDYSGTETEVSGGSRYVEISTPKGTFNVWTKRVGNNPRMKVLILHGGPGGNSSLYEAFDSYLPKAGIEYYYYDQLGSTNSDKPEDESLWTVERFVDEVEQVRRALGLDHENFYLYGQSWGGILAIEYALEHQEHLKGLIISNMMASLPAYDDYAENVLGPQMPPDVLAEIKSLEKANAFDDPRYMELLLEHYYREHLLRMPREEWPNPVAREFPRLNHGIYVLMQGPSEFGVSDSARLADWDRTAELDQIRVPTLVIGAEHDTMDPEHMRWMAGELPKGRYLHCPEGSHLAIYDDQKVYFEGLVEFTRDVDAGALSD